jgi:hypothetical protein
MRDRSPGGVLSAEAEYAQIGCGGPAIAMLPLLSQLREPARWPASREGADVTPRNRSRIYLLAFGGMFFLTSALNLVRFYAQPSDIWWTPRPLSVALADASDRVEVYVREMPLTQQISAGRIQLVTDAGVVAVAAPDVRLRFNNWDRVRAQKLPSLVTTAFCAGASSVFVLLGIFGWIPTRRR